MNKPRKIHISELESIEAKSLRPLRPQGARDAGKTAYEQVRSTSRRVMQGAILGGYWLYSGGRPIFVRTVGKKVRSGKAAKQSSSTIDKLPVAPSANRTINSIPNKPKKSVARPPKKRVATKIARIDKKKAIRIQG